VASERATEPGGESERAGTFGNLFLEQPMRERIQADAERRGSDPNREPARATEDVDGRREPLVVVERDGAIPSRAHHEGQLRRGLTASPFARVDASVHRLRSRMFRGVERTPPGLRLGLFLVVGLVAVTISQIEYSGTEAERDRAVQQAAAAKQVAGELRRDNAILANERDSARDSADAATHALQDATTDLRRWRRIAADRQRRADRARRHR
jgi:hypothetical protein